MLPCFIVKTLFFATEFTCRPRQNFSMGHNLWNFGYGFTREPDGTETWEAVFLFQGRTWKHKMEVFLEGQPLFQLLLLALKKNQMRWVSGSGLQMLPCWIMALQRRNPSRTLCIRLFIEGIFFKNSKHHFVALFSHFGFFVFSVCSLSTDISLDVRCNTMICYEKHITRI